MAKRSLRSYEAKRLLMAAERDIDAPVSLDAEFEEANARLRSDVADLVIEVDRLRETLKRREKSLRSVRKELKDALRKQEEKEKA